MEGENENKDNIEQEGEEVVKVTSVIDNAKEQADRLEAANKKQEQLIIRQEELYARQQLGGHATAGQRPEKPKEKTDEEIAEKFSDGEMDILA